MSSTVKVIENKYMGKHYSRINTTKKPRDTNFGWTYISYSCFQHQALYFLSVWSTY